ncbi:MULTISPECIES: aspartate/glutamate racemase family protein [Lonsdalea]|uniref:Asp/Glu racemase n=2 Tax=Lonsdalea TaxID=1082702 RepID=A0ACD1J9T9_9GAMM|nr:MULTISPECIES: aspartate/glutamate racemase family protein [Lonsdalea]OSM94686.1 Asp/Glu racemase [Lonsdalea populi]OSM99726.1 Asp/Glu racemase [Lonsdalea populi]QPQ24841.1 aspartate/glutamate racemase family protein [Lonsdalea populi]RAT12038.1 Asp/Glu racemase [Lonsdalea quercina]RAT14711.1 Asp/Glu racemase [Lonsdalea quercina]
MSRCVIQVINPNTSREMTDTIDAAARRVANADTEILSVCASYGAPSVEGHVDEAIAALGVLAQIQQGRSQGVHGHVIACFGDPGLLAARELATAPVVGIAEAAMHMATLVATRFSIVTTLPRTLIIARHLLHQYGFERHCAALHAIDLPVLALEDGQGLAQQKVREQCIQSKQKDGSGAIVLGCGGMADLAVELTHELGIPVIDGVSAAVKLIESLVGMGLTTSKHGDLDYPLPKPLTGPFSQLR